MRCSDTGAETYRFARDSELPSVVPDDDLLGKIAKLQIEITELKSKLTAIKEEETKTS